MKMMIKNVLEQMMSTKDMINNLKAYIKEKCGENMVPEEICYTGRY